jgi:predicted TIM-barrel fold metal-dependent hydrolase
MSFGNVPSANLVACVETYINPAVPIGTSLSTDASAPALHIIPSHTLAKMKNLGSARVKDMRNLGHSKEVISHVPIAAAPATCAKFNDALYTAIQLNTEKMVALALLPADGKEAAKELQRCVTKMKFVGGVVGMRSSDSGRLLESDFEDL